MEKENIAKQKRTDKMDEVIKYNLLKSSQEKIKQGKLILYGIAGLNLLLVAILGLDEEVSFEIVLPLIIAVIFAVLGYMSNKDPKKAISIGLGLYLGSIILAGVADPTTLFSGVFIKILIIGGLVKAYFSSKEAEELQKKLEDLENKANS